MNERPIGIIGAMDIEVEGLRSLMTDKESVTVSGIEYVSGSLAGKRVVVAKCGIGKVFAAIAAETMILKFSPSLILNTGVGGTLTKDLSVGDIAVAKAVVQHDMDTSAIGDPVGLISGINVIEIESDERVREIVKKNAAALGSKTLEGTIASGDKFISDASDKERIIKTFGAISCDMESGSIGQVCYVNGTPFCIIRAISDGADDGAAVSYETFAKAAAENSIKLIVKTLPEL